MVCSTERVGMSSVWWLTYPQILWNKLIVMGEPSRSTCPLVGPCVLLDITSSSALFPLPSIYEYFSRLYCYTYNFWMLTVCIFYNLKIVPLDPKTASTSPAFTSRETSFKISPVWMVPKSVWKHDAGSIFFKK